MFASIVSYGLAVGAVYALIGITYNVMFSASRVFSFTAGMLGMLGGVLGALFINGLGMNAVLAFVLVLAAGAVLGLVTEILTVRPVLKSIEQHLYVLSTLAFALMIQQVTAIEYNTEPQPFPVLFPIDPNSWLGIVDQKFWLPVLACIVTVLGLEFLYRHTLIGRAFLAIAEDSYAARALGLPETRLRMASYAIAGVIGALAGFTGAQMLLAFIGNQAILNFYGFVPVALGGMGSNRGAVIGGLALGLFQQAANFLVGGIFASVAVFAVFIIVLLLRPEGLAGAATARKGEAARMTDATSPISAAKAPPGLLGRLEGSWSWIILGLVGLLLPLLGDSYFGVIAQRAYIYWILGAGLNLVVGYAGQIAIGWVAMLTLGAYTTAALAAGRVGGVEWHPYLALIASGAMGAVFGVIVGLPALRLRTFYFAMTTLGFATIVTQVALAWKDVTGGGVGTPGPVFPWPFEPGWGFYYFCFILAAIATWITANIGSSRYGRALVAIRDAEVAAEASGIAKPKLLILIFLLAGGLGGVAGGLFSSLQSYITPDAFTFEMSVLFFIGILIGGRGSILGPLLGTIILTVLPEFAAPLVQWSTFLYAALLLVIVLVIPGGIADLLDYKNRRPLEQHREIVPRPELLSRILDIKSGSSAITLANIELHFGGVRAIDGLDLEIRSGEVHGLIGPNGSGKTTTLNVISGYYRPNAGQLKLNGAELPLAKPHARAGYRIARTFQTPRLVGGASVLENVMIGGTIDGSGTFAVLMLSLPRHRQDEKRLNEAAMRALATVGLELLADVRADRLQHSELRFMEIARALMLRPAFLLLDEPAAGLSAEEIRRLGALIKAISREGTGVLLVEHHADLIFDICDRVTVLNLGKTLAAGTPAEIRSHREVVSAYLGA